MFNDNSALVMGLKKSKNLDKAKYEEIGQWLVNEASLRMTVDEVQKHAESVSILKEGNHYR
jgi:hypothetical protein